MKPKQKYTVIIERRDYNKWIFVTILLSIFALPDADLKDNYVMIVNESGGIVKEMYYSYRYKNAEAKKRLIEEDLNNLTVSEFEEKYINVLEKISTKEYIEVLLTILAIILVLWIAKHYPGVF